MKTLTQADFDAAKKLVVDEMEEIPSESLPDPPRIVPSQARLVAPVSWKFATLVIELNLNLGSH